MLKIFYVKHRNLNNIHKVEFHPEGYLMSELFRASNREWTVEHLNKEVSFSRIHEACKDNPFNIVSEDLDSILMITELIS